ncbi:hypothetical protein [Bacillus halotolerans]|uniref:Uncharacterized protein n=1 Tax=Bacillus halotolerans TaxID=260554 RepID=A0A9Q4HST6_9BACI|nr:hypothetical protein [Bacillus halotolerans]MCY9186532.1 hypothetical protein [Bacillus halotolerans]
MQTINKKPIRVMDLFNLGEEYQGKEFKVVTDNEHYGKTIALKNGQLINKRDGSVMAATSDLLLNTKVRLKDAHTKVPLNEFLDAYKAGKKVGVLYKETLRELNNSASKNPEEPLFGFISVIPFNAVITMDELLNGEFYIIN